MRFCAITIVLASLLSCGCVRSIHPILKDEQVIVDDSVVGKWTGKEGDDAIDVLPPMEKNVYKVIYTDDKGKTGNFVMRLGKIGDNLIAEFTPDEPAPDMSDMYKTHLLPLYSFMVIHQTTPQISASLMSPDWLEKYLEKHPDELRHAFAGADNKSEGLIITASTEDFQTFLLRHWKDEGAWGNDKATFVRPGDPTTRPTTQPK